MKNFTYHVPTKVVFGTDTERSVGELLASQGAQKVLIIHGKQCQSCKGLYERVTESLDKVGILYNDIGGVEPPALRSKAVEGIALGRIEDVDYVLAVGGGSVIDMAKAVAIGIPNDGDIWDYYGDKRRPKTSLPVGVIVTSIAGGGEMSAISKLKSKPQKMSETVYYQKSRPHFAVMNPMLTYTLPMDSLQGGVAEVMMLTMARYFTHDSTMELTDNVCEVFLRVLIRNAEIIMTEPNNYEARANVMWASALAHNELTSCGNGWGDLSVHLMQQELSGRHDVEEGVGLAALWCAWAESVYRADVYRFYRYGRTVWNLPREFGTKEEIAAEAIRLTEEFFTHIGMLGGKVCERYVDLEIDSYDLTERTMHADSQIGSLKVLTVEDVRAIYELAVRYIKEGI